MNPKSTLTYSKKNSYFMRFYAMSTVLKRLESVEVGKKNPIINSNYCLHLTPQTGVGIHISHTDSAICMWDESLTGHGGNETASGVLKVLLQPSLRKRKKLVLWNDNCIGQNKNKIILMLIIYLNRTILAFIRF
ncbi:hypothetical protein NQ318_010367 [Aromia moschata]|uniref:Uncharacterized protein n=1 Tax=Aromia moschata TaxID=1265417 RepID=A0AAV8XPT8_9CUCU|nr:hypothetical protein NQ318_010367 [Aromia moschata]